MMNFLPDHLRQLAKLVGRHEAAHYVVGRVLGFKTGDCTLMIIGPINGHSGGAEIELAQEVTSLEQIITYLERRVQVLYAGALGQALEQGKVNNEAALENIKKYGQDDHAKVRELVHLIRNIKYPDDRSEEDIQAHLTEIDKYLWGEATILVETHHDLVAGLGDRLASEIKSVKVEARLTKEMIDQLPAIIERFGPTEPI